MKSWYSPIFFLRGTLRCSFQHFPSCQMLSSKSRKKSLYVKVLSRAGVSIFFLVWYLRFLEIRLKKRKKK